MKIQRKLILIYIAVVAILLTTTLAAITGILYYQRVELARDEAFQDAHELNGLMEIYPPETNPTFSKRVVETYGIQTKRHIWVCDATGKNIYFSHDGNSQLLSSPEIKDSLMATLGDQKARNISMDLSGIQRHFVVVPWISKGMLMGAIVMEYEYASVVELTYERVILFAVLMLIFGFIATRFIYIYTRKKIVNPMEELLVGIEKTRKGDRVFRFPDKGKDEFGKIAMAFNRLIEENHSAYQQIQEEIKELQEANIKLQKLEELKIVSRLSSDLLSTSTIDEMLNVALKQICPTFNARGGAVVLIDFTNGVFKRRVNYGLSEEYTQVIDTQKVVVMKNSYIHDVLKKHEPWVIKNIYEDPRFEPWRKLASVGKYVGFISTPLIARDAKLGVLNLYFDEECNPGERELKFLGILADQISVAFLRAQYEESNTYKVKQMTALYEFSQKIGSNLKLDYALSIVLEEVTRLLNVDYSLIRLLSEQTQELEVAATRGIPDDEKTKLPLLHSGLGLPGEIMKTGKAIYIPDVHKDTRLREYTLLQDQETYLGVPLRVGEKIIGVLSCMTKTPRAFSEDEIAYLSIIASEAGIAIENARLYSETKELTLTDALTQLSNVRRLHPQLEDELARAERYTRKVSFVMIDIDHFKKYNDTHGHPRGDIVLQKVAQLMMQHVRVLDQVYRYGGEELCIVLPETDKETAFQVAERIRQVIAEYPFYQKQTQPDGNLTISAGVATYPTDAISKEGLIAHADEALYQAKAKGRNQVQVYQDKKQSN